MKKTLIAALLAAPMTTLAAQPGSFSLGIDTFLTQNQEGSGLTATYQITDIYAAELSLAEAYLEGRIKTDSRSELHGYQTVRVGVNARLKEFDNGLRASLSAGLEIAKAEESLTSDSDANNTYFSLNLDVPLDEDWSLRFAMGSSGKGIRADKVVDEPEYAHGFNARVSLFYHF